MAARIESPIPERRLRRFDVLRRYLKARADFSDEEMAQVCRTFVPLTLERGALLQRAGEPARTAAFVVEGCLRTYVVDDTGNEHIVQFAEESWWVADIASLATGAPSQYFIEAVARSELLLIDPPSHEALVRDVPGYAAAFRGGLQKHAAAKDRRIVSSLAASAEARYLEFLETYPSVAARVPQRMIASYLGLTPETLSRIRRKLARRGRSDAS